MKLQAPSSGGRRASRSAPSSTTTSPTMPCSLVDRLGVSTSRQSSKPTSRKLARDYEVVGLDVVLSGKLPRRALLITFDDGYRSFIDVALPILRRLGLPSALFVTGACLDPYSPPARQPPLVPLRGRRPRAAWGAALDPAAGRPAHVPAAPRHGRHACPTTGAWRRARSWRSGSRSIRRVSEPIASSSSTPRISPGWRRVDARSRTTLAAISFCRSIVDEASADSQLVEHARRLESLTGRPVRAFSFPYGRREDATPMVERILRESGHEALFLAESRPDLQGSLGRLGIGSRWTAQEEPNQRALVEPLKRKTHDRRGLMRRGQLGLRR